MDLHHFQKAFQVKTNFLEYGSVCILLKKYFSLKDFPESKSPLPSNSYLKSVVHMDKKGVSNLYKTLQGR